jgi:APA family basic amino acid/polyamine antiporter
MIGLNIGGSLFLLTGIAVDLTGPSLFIAQIISATPVLLAIVPYLTLTSAIPLTTANYQYAKLFSRPLAVAAWMTMFIAIPIGAFPLFSIATAKLIVLLIPGLPVTLTAVLVMTVFYLVNIFGIKPAAYLQLATVAILLIALVTFIAPGIPAIQPQNLTPLFPGGAIGLIGASALLYTLLAGALFGIEIGGEVKNPRVTIPKALLTSAVIVLFIYLFIEIIAVGVIDWKVFAGETLGIPAQAFLSGVLLDFFVIGGGIFASTTTINLTLTVAGRYALSFAKDGFFPNFFGSINRRFGTPHWGLTLPYVMTVITLLLNPPLQMLGAMLNFGLLFMITLVLLAAFKLPRDHPEIYEKARVKFSPRTLAITSLTAVGINIIFMLLLAYALRWTFLIFVAAGIAGVVLYHVRKRQIGLVPVGFQVEQAD